MKLSPAAWPRRPKVVQAVQTAQTVRWRHLRHLYRLYHLYRPYRGRTRRAYCRSSPQCDGCNDVTGVWRRPILTDGEQMGDAAG